MLPLARGIDAFRRQEVYSLGLVAAVLVAAFAGLSALEPKVQAKAASVAAAVRASDDEPVPPRRSAFEGVSVQAKAAYVLDVSAGKALYAKNENMVLPLASVAKIMTAIAAVDAMPRNTVVRIRPEYLAQEGDTGLLVDESWQLKDLIDYSLVVSSNDGAAAIAAAAGFATSGATDVSAAESDFVLRMNAKARKIGLAHTAFSNPTGLDVDVARSGAYGTAKDMATLFSYALSNYPEILEATRYNRIRVNSLDNIPHVGINTNQGVNVVPGILASKTGYTDLSGGNLVIVFNAGLNRPIVVSVLGSTYDGRFEDVERLARAAMEEIGAAEEINP